MCDLDQNKLDENFSGDDFFNKTNCTKDLIESSDLVIEAANPKVAVQTLSVCIEKGKDVIIISVGGLLGNEDLLARAEKQNVNTSTIALFLGDHRK